MCKWGEIKAALFELANEWDDDAKDDERWNAEPCSVTLAYIQREHAKQIRELLIKREPS